MSLRLRVTFVVAAVIAGISAAIAPQVLSRAMTARRGGDDVRMAPAVGMPGAPPTSSDGLRQRIADMESRVRQQPADAASAVLLADALLRQARATTDGRPANRAADVLASVLAADPGQYDALRLMGAVQLSRHRFRDALEVARRARDRRPGDAWNYGVMGDALVELGDYDKAFEAFDTMASMRPNADAYARVSYARELRGDLEGALSVMRLAADATPAHDREAKAWYSAHVGELLLRMGRLVEAEREYRRAAFYFPQYPHAIVGLGKVKAAGGDNDAALEILLEQLHRTPTLDIAARVGDLFAARGARDEAERYYEMAEHLAGPAAAQTEPALALFLAERDRNVSEALQIARTVALMRHDIFTDDAVAWSSFKNGQLADAAAASQRALRTGTRDERILRHAELIRRRMAQGS